MSALVFSHIPLPHPTRAILLSAPPIFLSLSHYSFPLPLYKPPPINLSWTSSWNAHSQARKHGAHSFISHPKHIHTNTRALYYKYAFCTWDGFQATDASECIKDRQRSFCRKQKKRERKEARPRKTRFGHTCRAAAIISGHRCLSLEMSLMSPTVAVLPAQNPPHPPPTRKPFPSKGGNDRENA